MPKGVYDRKKLPLHVYNSEHHVFANIDMQSGDPHKCWLWKGNVHPTVGPRMRLRGKFASCRRLVWSLVRKDELPNKIKLVCENERCLNPHHMAVYKGAMKTLDAVKKKAISERRFACIKL